MGVESTVAVAVESVAVEQHSLTHATSPSPSRSRNLRVCPIAKCGTVAIYVIRASSLSLRSVFFDLAVSSPRVVKVVPSSGTHWRGSWQHGPDVSLWWGGDGKIGGRRWECSEEGGDVGERTVKESWYTEAEPEPHPTPPHRVIS